MGANFSKHADCKADDHQQGITQWTLLTDGTGTGLNGTPFPKVHPCPNLWNLQVLPYMVKDVIRSRLLKRGAYSGFSGWARNPVTCVLVRRTHREGGDGQLTTEAETRGSHRSRNTDSHQKMQGQEGLSPGGPGGSVACWPFDSSFCSPEFCSFQLWDINRTSNCTFQFWDSLSCSHLMMVICSWKVEPWTHPPMYSKEVSTACTRDSTNRASDQRHPCV